MSGEIGEATVGLFFVSVKVDGQGMWGMGRVGSVGGDGEASSSFKTKFPTSKA